MQAGKRKQSLQSFVSGAWVAETVKGDSLRGAAGEWSGAGFVQAFVLGDPLSGDPLPGKSCSGKSSSGNPRLALCGLALIYAVEIPVDIFLQPKRLRERNVSRIKTYTSTDPVRPLGDRRPDTFKLQWICSDRNIDRARKVWAAGCLVGADRASRECRLLHSASI